MILPRQKKRSLLAQAHSFQREGKKSNHHFVITLIVYASMMKE
jgi:hypothetical protein